MSENPSTEKANKTIATQVSPELFGRIEDYRWENRLSIADFIKLAIIRFLDYETSENRSQS